MENTLESKAKFYSQYLFTGVIFKYQNTSWGKEIIDKESALDLSMLDLIMSHTDIHEDYVNKVRNGFLELKPLSMISDEDLLKISELLSWRKSMQESSIMAQTKELLLSQSQTNLYREHWSDIVDKVRELGYAHKWNGVTVSKQIEYGWIKLKKN